MSRTTIFGAGAAGTALAIHLARKGEPTALWASRYDEGVLPHLEKERTHPALPEHLPSELEVHGPDALFEAAADVRIAIMGANSGGARSLASMIGDVLSENATVVSIAKGLEPESGRRMSEVYSEALPGRAVVAISGPSLAPELAEGLPTAVVAACGEAGEARRVAEVLRSPSFLVDESDDVIGVEVCGTAKNVAAIGAGVLEGLAQHRQRDMKNARAALYTRALHELAALAEAAGGRRETAFGLAGAGDLLVTSLGGRNRMYGEAIGMGAEPRQTLEEMTKRGMTVEGADSATDVHVMAKDLGLELPVHESVHRVVHEGAPPTSILEALT